MNQIETQSKPLSSSNNLIIMCTVRNAKQVLQVFICTCTVYVHVTCFAVKILQSKTCSHEVEKYEKICKSRLNTYMYSTCTLYTCTCILVQYCSRIIHAHQYSSNSTSVYLITILIRYMYMIVQSMYMYKVHTYFTLQGLH